MQQEAAAVPAPGVAVGLFFARRRLHPDRFDFEMEAMCVTAVICGRAGGRRPGRVTLGDLAAAHTEYAPRLPHGHPVLQMLLERFGEVSFDAEEEALAMMKDDTYPHQAQAHINECLKLWGAPSVPLGGPEVEFFEMAREVVKSLQSSVAGSLQTRLALCQTKATLDSLAADIEKEYEKAATSLRSQVRVARQQHMEHMMVEATTKWGWPPDGSYHSIARDARWYAHELGPDHAFVDDFAGAVKRRKKELEKECRLELTPMAAQAAKLRAPLNTDPPPPRLWVQEYVENLEMFMIEASQRIQHWTEVLGFESTIFSSGVCAIIGKDEFFTKVWAEVEETKGELHRLGPPRPELPESAAVEEGRLQAGIHLHHLLAALQIAGEERRARDLQQEFASVLGGTCGMLSLLDPSHPGAVADPGDDDGWHNPPGWQHVDERDLLGEAPLAPLQADQTRRKSLAKASELHPRVCSSITLHGVAGGDCQIGSEIALLHKCAEVIAEECGISRENVTNLSIFDPVAGAQIMSFNLECA